MLKRIKSVIHVEIKSSHEHLYYSTLKALYYDKKVSNLIAIKYQTLRTKNITSTHHYENEYIIIRKGFIMTSTNQI